ncbi:MAG: hypothetical protein DWQ19_12710 [Crenarchaeota archaeon]|nr:MAG: hypothetical protein DWQ19_12710 [Thermoproteota archaeon]
MSDIETYQTKLNEIRQLLSGTEYWETLEDDKKLKFQSPKFIAYRKSGAYRALKKTREEIDGYKCTKCHSNKNLHFHHLTYKNLFHEHLTDGITLCNVCHTRSHEIRKGIYNTYKGIKMTTTIAKGESLSFIKNQSCAKKYLEFLAHEYKKNPTTKKTQLCGLADKLFAGEYNLKSEYVRQDIRYVWGIKESAPDRKTTTSRSLTYYSDPIGLNGFFEELGVNPVVIEKYAKMMVQNANQAIKRRDEGWEKSEKSQPQSNEKTIPQTSQTNNENIVIYDKNGKPYFEMSAIAIEGLSPNTLTTLIKAARESR